MLHADSRNLLLYNHLVIRIKNFDVAKVNAMTSLRMVLVNKAVFIVFSNVTLMFLKEVAYNSFISLNVDETFFITRYHGNISKLKK